MRFRIDFTLSTEFRVFEGEARRLSYRFELDNDVDGILALETNRIFIVFFFYFCVHLALDFESLSTVEDFYINVIGYNVSDLNQFSMAGLQSLYHVRASFPTFHYTLRYA